MFRKALGIAIALVVLAGAGMATRELTRPASVTIEEQTVTLEPGDVRAVHATASGGLPFSTGLSWRIVPSWLGTISPDGQFRAGAVTGSGTVTAEVGSASAQVAVTVTCPKQTQVAGVRFDVSCGRWADVYVDVTASGGATLALASLEREAAQVSRDLQIPLERRFRVYFFGSTPGYLAVVSDLGRGFSSAPAVSEGDALYLDVVDIIAIDQSQTPSAQADAVLRHELVHRFIRQYVGYANIDEIPTWLNEGWATLEEYGAASWLRTEARFVSASMAYVGKLPSLASLTDLYDWNSRTGLDGYYQYYVAAQATQFLIDDLKLAGVRQVLKRVREGESFAEAFSRAVPDVTYGAFEKRFPGRVAALAQDYPGIAATRGSPQGSGSTVVVYGLTPNAGATFTLTGPMEGASSVTIDAYGVAVKYLGTGYATGEYLVTLESEGKRLSVKAIR